MAAASEPSAGHGIARVYSVDWDFHSIKPSGWLRFESAYDSSDALADSHSVEGKEPWDRSARLYSRRNTST